MHAATDIAYLIRILWKRLIGLKLFESFSAEGGKRASTWVCMIPIFSIQSKHA